MLSQILPEEQASSLSADCRKALTKDEEIILSSMVINPPSGDQLFVRGSCRGISYGDTQRVIMWLENLSEPHRAVQIQQIRQINDQFSQEMTALLLSDRFELASTRVCLRLGDYLNLQGVAWYWSVDGAYHREARWFEHQPPPDSFTWDDFPSTSFTTQRYHVAAHIPPAYQEFTAGALMVSAIPQSDGPPGLLVIWSRQSRTWTDEENTLLRQLCNSVALAKQHHNLVIARDLANSQAMDHARLRAERLATHSYNLRTPLASLLGLLDVEEQLPKQQILPLIRNSSEQLLSLLQEYSDREHADAGNIFLHEQRCKLLPLITEEVAAYRRKFLSTGHSIDLTTFGNDQAAALIDPLRLRQVVKLMLECGLEVQPQVQIEAHILDDELRLSLNDHEGTITPTSLEVPVNILRGRIEHGTQLTACIPIRATSEATTTSNVVQSRHQGNLIMIIEDDRTSREYLSLILRSMKHHCISAENGAVALEILSQREDNGHQQPDLILMDCLMPVMDGYETTQAIRQSTSSFATTPIVALTAQAMSGDRERCLAAGMTAYLSKPVSRSAFTTVLDRLLPEPLTGTLPKSDSASTDTSDSQSTVD